jgi:general secretion pathway protein E
MTDSITFQALPYSFAKNHGVLLLQAAENEIQAPEVIYKGSCTAASLLELRRYLGRDFRSQPVEDIVFQQALNKLYDAKGNTASQVADSIIDDVDLSDLLSNLPKPEDLLDSQDDAPIIRLLNALFTEAIKQNASDIHIETFEEQLTVRYRIDGVLRQVLTPQRALAPMLVSRIKVMAKLDIAEKRLPQDGRISLQIGGHNVDLRISTLPTAHGERVVMRILDKQQAKLDLARLGMFPEDHKAIEALIHQPYGIMLVTGPTGSGKTTTLYASLTELNTGELNILTVEDPIEYDLPGVAQTQVNLKAEMTFARGLRAMLRQDPDVVMVGEIRDLETAETAIQASLTGHLVLATLHTNSAIGAITRVEDIGVQSFLISSSLIGMVAQRLVRLLCPDCKKAAPADAIACTLLGIKGEAEVPLIYHPVGCNKCGKTGYLGRTGIYEVITVDDTLRHMITKKVSEQELEKHARTRSMSMQADGIRRILNGTTTVEEVLRVTNILV